MRRLHLALALLAISCVGCDDGALAQLTLRLVDDTPACTGLQVAMVRSVEVIAVGTTTGGADCQLDRRCVEVSTTGMLNNLNGQLADRPGPLLDVPTATLRSVRVRGFDTAGCEGAIRLCGLADVGGDGMLAVPTVCDSRLSSRCPATALPICP